MIGGIISDVISSAYEFWPAEDKDFPLWNKNTEFTDDTVMTIAVGRAILSFLESDSYEDVIRNAVSLGGDADTLGAITGAIAWAYYGRNGSDSVMKSLADKVCANYLPQEFIDTLNQFNKLIA